MNRRLGRPQSLSGRLWEEKALFFLPVFEPRTIPSVATHYTDCTPHLKYLSTAQYRDDLSLWSPVGYSLSVALLFGVEDCIYRERVLTDGSIYLNSDVVNGCKFSCLLHNGIWNSVVQIHRILTLEACDYWTRRSSDRTFKQKSAEFPKGLGGAHRRSGGIGEKRLSILGNKKFFGCPGCILMHYSNYVIPEEPSWYFNQESQESVACRVSLQAFQWKARIHPQVTLSSTPSTSFSVHCSLTHSYSNV